MPASEEPPLWGSVEPCIGDAHSAKTPSGPGGCDRDGRGSGSSGAGRLAGSAASGSDSWPWSQVLCCVER